MIRTQYRGQDNKLTFVCCCRVDFVAKYTWWRNQQKRNVVSPNNNWSNLLYITIFRLLSKSLGAAWYFNRTPGWSQRWSGLRFVGLWVFILLFLFWRGLVFAFSPRSGPVVHGGTLRRRGGVPAAVGRPAASVVATVTGEHARRSQGPQQTAAKSLCSAVAADAGRRQRGQWNRPQEQVSGQTSQTAASSRVWALWLEIIFTFFVNPFEALHPNSNVLAEGFNAICRWTNRKHFVNTRASFMWRLACESFNYKCSTLMI